MKNISDTDLIINPDGSVYHLNLLPEDIADTVITVGDPDRVSEVSQHFDRIELKKGKREFITHTGYLGSRRITVISTGIGTDNIDIVLNELDALVNIDFHTRTVNDKLKNLSIIRIGTSGAIQNDIPMDTILVSEFGLGLDALMNYYLPNLSGDEHQLLDSIRSHFKHIQGISPYLTAADKSLMDTIGKDLEKGITVTAPGFYAPQGREVRAKTAVSNLISLFSSFRSGNYRLTNLEMETAGIYALASVLGHKAISVNAILASRTNREFSANPGIVIDKAIKLVLDRLH
ncbi:nucleoside phosphorylase [Daejeonella lutea]|uniref:Uridine phosphorylase n=1 Tax=Daejeonella lutea TaxID=572036 RepID=A0A1T5AHH2_9SPHI|nr:nucleoside phosphorylase [Daejeonella lutea]SKB34396.1 uridine phosphorylase [Daejeonella lutea]